MLQYHLDAYFLETAKRNELKHFKITEIKCFPLNECKLPNGSIAVRLKHHL